MLTFLSFECVEWCVLNEFNNIEMVKSKFKLVESCLFKENLSKFQFILIHNFNNIKNYIIYLKVTIFSHYII